MVDAQEADTQTETPLQVPNEVPNEITPETGAPAPATPDQPEPVAPAPESPEAPADNVEAADQPSGTKYQCFSVVEPVGPTGHPDFYATGNPTCPECGSATVRPVE